MIKILHAYPDLLNLYGDYANVRLLQRRLRAAGIDAVVESFETGDGADFSDAALVFFGAGTENKMLAAARDGVRYAMALKAYIGRGGTAVFCGASAALAVSEITGPDGKTAAGFGLIEGTAKIHDKRRYSEVAGRCALVDRPVLGTFNSSLELTTGGPPFLTVTHDLSGCVGAQEGYAKDGLLITQLSGPLFFRNPPLLDAVAERLAGRALGGCDEAWYRELWLGYEQAVAKLGIVPK